MQTETYPFSQTALLNVIGNFVMRFDLSMMNDVNEFYFSNVIINKKKSLVASSLRRRQRRLLSNAHRSSQQQCSNVYQTDSCTHT